MKQGKLIKSPLVGIGTTAKMALLNKRNSIGFEISKEYCDIVNLRISNVQSKWECDLWN